jgi:hypothetical protein
MKLNVIFFIILCTVISSCVNNNTDSKSATDDPPTILWRDSLQDGTSPWGFDILQTEHPIGTAVDPLDANGANLSRTPDPLGSSGYALSMEVQY